MFHALNEPTELFAAKLYAIIEVPRFDDTDRVRASHIAVSMSLEHWDATRNLLESGLLPSALVVHRAQFEALVRSVWLFYAASDVMISKLLTTLSPDSEQAAKNLPQTAVMMAELSIKAPPQAYDALNRFKENSWKALNSYAHAGIHPLRRHEEGYSVDLLNSVLRNSNGLAVVAGMQTAVLSGRQPLVKEVLAIALAHPSCMPPPI
ncbi:MAG: hypothetical protein WBK51_01715 [Polaromonas sp.]